MIRIRRWSLWVLTLLVLQALVACSGLATMTPQQKEAFELRRYCERTNDVERCHGFMGFL
jgi:hypothetical protein